MTEGQLQYSLPACYFIWGKTDRYGVSRERSGPAWNPLFAHVLDTAACVGALWDRYLTPNVRTRLTHAFGDGDEHTARLVVMLLAGLHDLGKGSTCFLHRFGTGLKDSYYVKEARTQWEAQARAAGLPLPQSPGNVPDARHEHITAIHLPLVLGCGGCLDPTGDTPCHQGLHDTATLLGGHHGHIPNPATLDRTLAAAPLGAWEPLYRELANETAALIGVSRTALPRLVNPQRPSSLPLFAGLVILADWIASSEDHFTFRSLDTPASTWWTQSQQQADQALTALHLDAWTPIPATWTSLFPGTTPRPFQVSTMAALPATGPALAIIESGTGSGKTRLALWCAHHLALTCGYQGLYMAMPTRAATNQTAAEIKTFLSHALGDQEEANLALVHGTAEGSDIVQELLDANRTTSHKALDGLEEPVAATLVTDQSPHEPAPTSRAVLEPWYLRRCLGLVSAFGIGTVDQVVLGAQRSQHWMLRMFALAGKTLIIDEAHAYELFQQGMLAAMVEWLADAGASVVVLSATLPAAVRQTLADAWCRGQRVPATATRATGPITIIDQHGTIQPVAPVPPAKLHTDIDFLATDAAAFADRLLSEASDKGITAVVRNRVATANELHTMLLDRAERYGWRPEEIVLLHGRIMPRQRLAIEDNLTKRLGPNPGADRNSRNPNRPDRLLVIATQVIEQSLDLDFDRLYTDLAPIDLLIQRRGRLHRHTANDSERPGWCKQARMTVLWQPDPHGLPMVEPPDLDTGTSEGNWDGLVYAPYILTATWRILAKRAGLDGIVHMTTPDHSSELIETAYGPMPDRPSPFSALEARTWDGWQKSLDEDANYAEKRVLRPYGPQGDNPVHVTGLASGHNYGHRPGIPGIRAISRLGNPSIDAIALYQQHDTHHTLTYDPAGQLPADQRHYKGDSPARRRQQRDFRLNTITIPAHWFQGKSALPNPTAWPTLTNGPLRYTHVALFNPTTGRCLSGPTSLTYHPTTGLTR